MGNKKKDQRTIKIWFPTYRKAKIQAAIEGKTLCQLVSDALECYIENFGK